MNYDIAMPLETKNGLNWEPVGEGDLPPLTGVSYTDSKIFELERRTIFQRFPVLGATVNEVERPGEYTVSEIAEESVIIVRDKRGKVHALANTCRHRGAQLVQKTPTYTEEGSNQPEDNSKTKRDLESYSKPKKLNCLTCPYHAWRYDLDGRLIAARGEESEQQLHGTRLRRMVTQESAGLIFYHSNPEHYTAVDNLNSILGQLNLSQAKIGARKTYKVEANWKLWVENFLECWHCAPNHPELRSTKDFIMQFEQGDLEAYISDESYWREKAACNGWTPPPDLEFGIKESLFSFNLALPLGDGKASATKNGQRIGPALGTEGLEGGAIFGALGPFLFYMAYVDYVVLFSVQPSSVKETRVEVSWLVSPEFSGPQEDLTWLWDTTIKQDIALVQMTQKGVNSLHYTPGQFSADEYRTQGFTAWWHELMQDQDAGSVR